MVTRLISLALIGLVVSAGGAIVVAVFLTAQGPAGPSDQLYPGSIIDLLPAYGALLVACGLAVAGTALAALWFRRAAPAVIACGIAFVAGCSLEIVHVSYRDAVIARSHPMFELRGTGTWTAGVSCLAALVLAAQRGLGSGDLAA